MALALNTLGGGFEGAPTGSSCSTISIAPGGNRLVLAWIYQAGEIGGSTAAVSLSGNGLTWVQIADVVFTGNGGEWPGRLQLFRAMGTAPSSGVVTITWGSPTPEKVAYSIAEWSGVDTSGTNGSGAIAQYDTDYSNSDVTTLAPTLGSFGSASNGVAAGFGRLNGSGTFSAEGGYTLIHDLAGDTRSSLGTEYLGGNDTTPTATWETASAAAIAVEIVAAPPITREVNDTVGATTSLVMAGEYGRTAADAASTTDAAARALEGTRVLADVADIVDAVAREAWVEIVVADEVGAVDSATRTLDAGRTGNDAIVVTSALHVTLDTPVPVPAPIPTTTGPGGLGFGND